MAGILAAPSRLIWVYHSANPGPLVVQLKEAQDAEAPRIDDQAAIRPISPIGAPALMCTPDATVPLGNNGPPVIDIAQPNLALVSNPFKTKPDGDSTRN